MEIVVYQATTPAPDGFGFVAHIIDVQPGAAEAGKPRQNRLGFHPVVFRSDTEEGAREKAATWWQSEIDKATKREENYRKLGEGAAARAAAKRVSK